MLDLLYPYDIVRLKEEQSSVQYGVVMRVWHDEVERLQSRPSDQFTINRALVEGEYGVEFYPSYDRVIINGANIVLLDRPLRIGQSCKLTSGQGLLGQVTSTRAELKLQDAVSSQEIPGMFSEEDIELADPLSVGEHVIYKNWVGVIVKTYAAGKVRTPDLRTTIFSCVDYGQVRLGPVEALDDLEVTPKTYSSHSKGTIVEQQKVVICVHWLAINDKLDPAKQEQCPMPKQFWTEFDQLLWLPTRDTINLEPGKTVVLCNEELYPRQDLTLHGGKQEAQLRILRILYKFTKVEILWQNGTSSFHSSTDLVPFRDFHGQDIFCGDHVSFLNSNDLEQSAVVQLVDPSEGIARLLPYGSEGKETMASLLEIRLPPEDNKLQRGDVVLISRSSRSPQTPNVPQLGAIENEDGLSEEQIERLLASMGKMQMTQSGNDRSLPVCLHPENAREHDVDWYGHVSDMGFDGKIAVSLPNGQRVYECLSNLSILDDNRALERFEEGGEAESVGFNFGTSIDIPWVTEDGERVQEEDWEDASDDDAPCIENLLHEETNEEPTGAEGISFDKTLSDEDCPSFAVLEEAPCDHFFHTKQRTTSAFRHKNYLSRLREEHRMLQNALPRNVFVRTYEDRSDLFRSLILGPRGTPFEDAPICIDFHLGASYPEEPPLAHFHSWTKGLGQISPNLYEDGNICLSILGTWVGEGSESWDPTKSTLLQVLVSIQGLVLVSEPYYTETGGDIERNTESSKFHSHQYTERTFVLTRRFILHILKHPLAGLEKEIRTIYMAEGLLGKVIHKAQLVSQRSPETIHEDEVTITRGGRLALARIIEELQTLITSSS